MSMSLVSTTDAGRLLALARTGDSPALGRLLERYRAYLTLLARVQIGRRLQGKVDAADLVQEAFLKAHQHFGEFRGGSEAEWVSWLRTILATTLASLVHRHYARQRRDVRLECDLAAELEQSSRVLDAGLLARQSSPSQQAARAEETARLADALERLPEDYREVLVLRHLEGLSFPEVAQRMERSVGAVEKLWVRALARLRRALGEAS
jgi:RNA polymerase sigma-70 factor, ECF subfamily